MKLSHALAALCLIAGPALAGDVTNSEHICTSHLRFVQSVNFFKYSGNGNFNWAAWYDHDAIFGFETDFEAACQKVRKDAIYRFEHPVKKPEDEEAISAEREARVKDLQALKEAGWAP